LGLKDIVQAKSGGCTVRKPEAGETEGAKCAQCHRSGAQPPNLENISRNAFCQRVPFFIRADKPENLIDFFDDWFSRGCPN
jgi:hypothetical protein